MLSLSSPLWLLAMAALPLVWWLHRFQDPDRAYRVAALFLWSAHDAPGSQLQRSRRADPVWLLRALTTFLLVAALCGPGWSSRDRGALHIWIDDSPSMFTLEQGSTRMTQALLHLERQLSRNRFDSIIAHSLATPGENMTLDPAANTAMTQQLLAWMAAPHREPQPPAPAIMDVGARHWLLSDGASPDIARWLQQAPVDRLIRVGSSTENVGLTTMALRRGGGGNSSDRLLVTAANGGLETAKRDLEISVDGQLLAVLPLRIPAGMQVHEVIDMPDTPREVVRANIGPGDALPDDDFLEFSATGLRAVTVAVSDDCGEHLRAALASHAALVPGGESGSAAELAVLCGEQGVGLPGPALRIWHGRGSAPVAGPLIWLAPAGPLRNISLDPAWLAAQEGNVSAGASQVLLRAGGAPLIMFDAVARVIDVRLDMAAPGLVRRPEYPLLVAGLVDLLLADTRESSGLLSVVNPSPVSIAPQPLSLNDQRPAAAPGPVKRDFTGPLILAALLTLLIDPALRGRRLARGSRKTAQAMESG